MKKVLICGATGFIGRNITETLSRRPDLDVHAVSHRRPGFQCDGVTWHQADLRKEEDVIRLLDGVDVIIQAAATTSGSKDIVNRPYIHVTDNAVMNSLLLRAAYDLNIKHFVFFSCTVMYQSSDKLLREEDFDASIEMHPRYFGAGWTKLYIENMCEFYSRLDRAKFTVIRHSNIYGPHDKFDLERSHMLGATITKVMTSTDGEIGVWGTGEEERDVLYVGDLVEFVEQAIDRQDTPYELVNVGSGVAVSVKELVHSVIKASGRDIKIKHDLSQPSINTSLALNCEKAEKMYGWKPQTSLKEGLAATISWWKENSPV